MSPHRGTSALVLVVLATVLLLAGNAAALPPAAGRQPGRATVAAGSIPRAQEASLFCGFGTPVIGGPVGKRVCEGGEKVLGGLAGEAIGAAGKSVMDSLTEWMIGAARTITVFVAREMRASTTPQLGAGWYRSAFAQEADLGAALGLLVSLIALTSAAIRRDPQALAATLTGILRAGIGTGLVVALTMIALEVADQISAAVLTAAPQSFWGTVSHAWGTSGFGGFESAALAMLIALVEVLCGLGVWLELIIRNAAIYVAVLFFPVALAASIWPALNAWTSRLARILQLLVSFKPVAIIVLSFAGRAAAAGLRFNGNASGSIGTILAAIVIFALAAFTPWVLMYLLAADAESAHAAMGVRAAAAGAVANGQARSLRNLSRSEASRAGGGSRRGGAPPNAPGGGSSAGGGSGPRTPGGGGTPPTSHPSAGGDEIGGDEALVVAGEAIGGGNLGAAAGVAMHARAAAASSTQARIAPSLGGDHSAGGTNEQRAGPSGGEASNAAASAKTRRGSAATELNPPDTSNSAAGSADRPAATLGGGQEPAAASAPTTEPEGTVVRLPAPDTNRVARRNRQSRRPIRPPSPNGQGEQDG